MATINGGQFPGVEVQRHGEADLLVVVLAEPDLADVDERLFAIVLTTDNENYVCLDRRGVVRLARLLLAAEETILSQQKGARPQPESGV